jgi:hypothetical protein
LPRALLTRRGGPHGTGLGHSRGLDKTPDGSNRGQGAATQHAARGVRANDLPNVFSDRDGHQPPRRIVEQQLRECHDRAPPSSRKFQPATGVKRMAAGYDATNDVIRRRFLISVVPAGN